MSVPFGLNERGMRAGQGHGPTIGWLFSFASGPELVKDALIASIPCEALLREQVATACGHTGGIYLGRKPKISAALCVCSSSANSKVSVLAPICI